MDFAGWVIIVLGVIGIITAIIMCLSVKNTDETTTGVLWGLGIGFCIGGICLSALMNTHWERKLIRNEMGKYETKSFDSRDVIFKLVKPLPIVTKEIVTEKDLGEECKCMNCGYCFLSPKAEKHLFITDIDAYNKYMEKKAREINTPREVKDPREELEKDLVKEKTEIAKIHLDIEKNNLKFENERCLYEKEKALLEAKIALYKKEKELSNLISADEKLRSDK